ncbi:MAG TPA: arginine--tRNA ligase [Mycobacteriales bacterium]|nr:arginine--tRNA ligase [Mycobacteriales bacterium]
MTPAEVADAVLAAVASAVRDGELTVVVPHQVRVERPKSNEHGDYATSIALALSRPAGLPARQVGELLAMRLRSAPGIARVDVAGPGFLNLTLDESALGEIAGTVLREGSRYGCSAASLGQRLNLEFVSANPTGPVHIGAVRWAAVGDALARLLEACGAEVAREYYFNDAGTQIDHFAASLAAAARNEPIPADGYAGEYIAEIADRVLADHPGLLDRPPEEILGVLREDGVRIMLEQIRRSLADFGVRFDVYFLERSLHESGAIDRAVERLRTHGHVYEEEGAVWLRTTDFGDDKDRVLIRSSGEPTYFASDAAYYLDKRERGFDRIVMMLGADHHGYIGRMRAVVGCYGEDPDEHLEILIGQLVNLVRGGETVRMSKRAGNVVTLEDLVELVGVDAARYSLARSSTDSALDLDLDLITRQAADNPVFSVQYAHARICSVMRNAAELGIARSGPDGFDPGLLTQPREGDLLGALGEFPRVVRSAAELREPHTVARYLESLAKTYHRFYDSCRVLPLGDEEVTGLTGARLALCEATRIVIANGLGLLGVSAPERM